MAGRAPSVVISVSACLCVRLHCSWARVPNSASRCCVTCARVRVCVCVGRVLCPVRPVCPVCVCACDQSDSYPGPRLSPRAEWGVAPNSPPSRLPHVRAPGRASQRRARQHPRPLPASTSSSAGRRTTSPARGRMRPRPHPRVVHRRVRRGRGKPAWNDDVTVPAPPRVYMHPSKSEQRRVAKMMRECVCVPCAVAAVCTLHCAPCALIACHQPRSLVFLFCLFFCCCMWLWKHMCCVFVCAWCGASYRNGMPLSAADLASIDMHATLLSPPKQLGGTYSPPRVHDTRDGGGGSVRGFSGTHTAPGSLPSLSRTPSNGNRRASGGGRSRSRSRPRSGVGDDEYF